MINKEIITEEYNGNELVLKPKDYIIFKSGLKIENISNNFIIKIRLPDKYIIEKIKK